MTNSFEMMITTTDALGALCERLAGAEFVTVDTEFLRESTYYPRLCLIQVASEDEAVCIDPLAEGIDLTPFYELMRNQNVVKVFHAARQDLEIFYHRMKVLPSPLFDTQVAAMVCGFGDSVGYDTLVSKVCRVSIDKSSRFTDWSLRPLSSKQVEYALADVTYLREVYKKFRKMLASSGREHWLDEEMAVLTNPAIYHTEPENAWKRLRTRSSKPRFLAVLSEVAAWREQEAQARNLPRGRILRDESLEEIASHPPRNLEALCRVRGVSKGWAEGKHGERLLAAVERGVAIPVESAPKPLVSSGRAAHQQASAVIELLKVLLRHVAEEAKVAPRLIATVSDLEAIALSGVEADTQALKGWRGELFGQQALSLRAGELALAADGGRVRVIPIGAAS